MPINHTKVDVIVDRSVIVISLPIKIKVSFLYCCLPLEIFSLQRNSVLKSSPPPPLVKQHSHGRGRS